MTVAFVEVEVLAPPRALMSGVVVLAGAAGVAGVAGVTACVDRL